MDNKLKCKMGILLIATSRFKNLGAETEKGSYEQRKQEEADHYISAMEDFCDVIFPGIVYTREDINRTIQEFRTENVDGVFVLFLSWSEDFSWIRFLRDMPSVPILFVSKTPSSIDFENTNEETDFVGFLSVGGLVGSLEASGSIKRFNRPMMVSIIGQFEEIISKTKAFAHASAVRSQLLHSNFGLLPSYNELMWSTYVDPYNLFMKAGPELHFLSVSTLINEIEHFDPVLVQKTCDILSSKYKLLPDVDKHKFTASVRASLALEELARKEKLDVVVLNDVDQVLLTDVGLRPGFLPCPGTNDISVVPEGDIGGGLAVYILKLLSQKAVNFIEPFYIDTENKSFVAGHAGPNDYTDPKGNAVIARDVRFAKTSYKHAGAPFAWYVIPAGIKTMVHLSESNGEFKMVGTLVEALPTKHFITSYSHGRFRPLNGDTEDLFEKLLQIGVTQHFAVVDGNYITELTYLAKIMNFDFKLI